MYKGITWSNLYPFNTNLDDFNKQCFGRRRETNELFIARCHTLKCTTMSFRLMHGYLMRSTHQTGRCFYECDWHCLWV